MLEPLAVSSRLSGCVGCPLQLILDNVVYALELIDNIQPVVCYFLGPFQRYMAGQVDI